MLRRSRLRLRAVSSSPASLLRRAFRSAASLEAILSHSHPSKAPPPPPLRTRRAPPTSHSTTTPPSPAHTPRSPPASSTAASAGASSSSPSPPSSHSELKTSRPRGSNRAIFWILSGQKKFALELSRFIPSAVVFDHRQSTLARIPQLGRCPSNLELRIDTAKSSARAVFDYFSEKLAGEKSDSDMCENLLGEEDEERVSNVLKYVEDADLRRWQLPNTKEFHAALSDERTKLNCVTNPHVFEQLLQLDVSDLLARGKSFAHDRLEAAGKLIHNPFKIQLGRGSYGECLTNWSSSLHAAWYPEDLLEDYGQHN